jgi:hypothetical protein
MIFFALALAACAPASGTDAGGADAADLASDAPSVARMLTFTVDGTAYDWSAHASALPDPGLSYTILRGALGTTGPGSLEIDLPALPPALGMIGCTSNGVKIDFVDSNGMEWIAASSSQSANGTSSVCAIEVTTAPGGDGGPVEGIFAGTLARGDSATRPVLTSGHFRLPWNM